MGYVTYKNQRVKWQTINEKRISNFSKDFSKFTKNYKFTGKDVGSGSSTISDTDLYFTAAWKKSRIHVSHIIQLVCVFQL